MGKETGKRERKGRNDFVGEGSKDSLGQRQKRQEGLGSEATKKATGELQQKFKEKGAKWTEWQGSSEGARVDEGGKYGLEG